MAFDAGQYKKVEREVYSTTAASYDKYGSNAFQVYAQHLLDGAKLKPGQHVLDVACGPGIPSLMVAPLVGKDGAVVGIDLAPGMVELAKKKAEEAGFANITFREADAEALPFQDDSFDVVLCNHGLVHTTDRVKALEEMWRVLKKGGIIAISTWSTPERSLTISVVAKAIREHFPAAIVPGAPMWFDFGPEGVLERALSDAGFDEISVARHTVVQQMQNGEEYWAAVVGISGRLQMLVESVPPEVASSIKADAINAADNFRAGEGLAIPCEELAAWANK
ncbi:MAG: methyltransferase domain-containing protein [Syntrophorhabdales bacterium]|jgi:ubiquinone/menaquinone biosynthesis C-methylase UbiE